MRAIAQLAVFLGLLALTGCGSSATWTDYTSSDGHFRVLMYGAPKETQEGTFHTVACAPQKGVVYKVTYGDQPVDKKFQGQPDGVEKYLYETSRILVDKLGGKLLPESKGKLTSGDVPGFETMVEVQAPEPGVHRIRVYQAADRYYQVEVFGPKDVATSEQANKFFDSFKITS
jgi:hypothetical protein